MSRRRKSPSGNGNGSGRRWLGAKIRAERERGQPVPGPIRLIDDSFSSRLIGKYGWQPDASFRREDLAHRLLARPEGRPPVFELQVSLFLRQIRLLLQPLIAQRIYLQGVPPRQSFAQRPVAPPDRTAELPEPAASGPRDPQADRRRGTARRAPGIPRTALERLRALLVRAEAEAGLPAVLPPRAIAPAAPAATARIARRDPSAAFPVRPHPPIPEPMARVRDLMILHRAVELLQGFHDASAVPGAIPSFLIRPERRDAPGRPARFRRDISFVPMAHLRLPAEGSPAAEPADRLREASIPGRTGPSSAAPAAGEPLRPEEAPRDVVRIPASLWTAPSPSEASQPSFRIESVRWLERLVTYSLHAHLAGHVYRTFDAELARPAMVRWMQAAPVRRMLLRGIAAAPGPAPEASGAARFPAEQEAPRARFLPAPGAAPVRLLHVLRAAGIPPDLLAAWVNAAAERRPSGPPLPEPGRSAGTFVPAGPAPGERPAAPAVRAAAEADSRMPPGGRQTAAASASPEFPGRRVPVSALPSIARFFFRDRLIREETRMSHLTDRTERLIRMWTDRILEIRPGRAPGTPAASAGAPIRPERPLPGESRAGARAAPIAREPVRGPGSDARPAGIARTSESFVPAAAAPGGLRPVRAVIEHVRFRPAREGNSREPAPRRAPAERGTLGSQIQWLVRLRERIVPERLPLLAERWLERIQSRVFRTIGDTGRVTGRVTGREIAPASPSRLAEAVKAPVHVRAGMPERAAGTIRAAVSETVRTLIRHERSVRPERPEPRERRAPERETPPPGRFLPPEWHLRVVEQLRIRRILDETARLRVLRIPPRPAEPGRIGASRPGDIRAVPPAAAVARSPLTVERRAEGGRMGVLSRIETFVHRIASRTDTRTLHIVQGGPYVREREPFRPVHAANRPERAEDRPARTAVARRPVIDVAMEVAHPPARQAARLEPDLKELRTAIRNVERDLNEVKANWTAPKVDFARLADSMYREFARRIRFEQQRRGL